MKKKSLKKPLVKTKVRHIMTAIRADKMRKKELNETEIEQIEVIPLSKSA